MRNSNVLRKGLKSAEYMIALLCAVVIAAGLMGCVNKQSGNETVGSLENASHPAETTNQHQTQKPTDAPVSQTNPIDTTVAPTKPVEPTDRPAVDPAVKPTDKPVQSQPDKPVETQPTNPTPTNPGQAEKPAVTPTVPANPDAENVIAGGKWDGGPVRWSLTADGVLTFTGNRSIQGSFDYPWKEYSHMITEIIVSDGITSIPNDMFSDMSNVRTVYLSNALEKIGESAFKKCTALQSVHFGDDLEYIGRYAFWNCTSLSTVSFSDNCKLEKIDDYAFSGTGITKLVIPSQLREISYNAFDGCTSLKTAILRGSIQSVKARAFANCPSLEHLVLGETITFKGGYLLQGSENLVTLEIYTSFAPLSFAGMEKLETVILGERVSYIPCFEGCVSLSSITIKGTITKIESDTFRDCVSLTSFTIPNTVTKIEVRAFAGSGIQEITIPASVTEIWMFAFSDSEIEKVYFKGDLPVINGDGIFNNITATAYYPADNATWTEDKLKDYGGQITWVKA